MNPDNSSNNSGFEEKKNSEDNNDIAVSDSDLVVKKKNVFKLEQKLGTGAFGKVYLGEYNNSIYAIKTIIKKNNTKGLNRIKMGSILQRDIKHSNIVSIEKITQDTDKILIVMEYCQNGSLFDFFKKKQPIWLDIKEKISQICKAVEYLHDNCIIHRDIKLANILLDDKYNIKLADFDFSKKLNSKDELIKGVCGTDSYIAPEIISNDTYGLKADVWSLGVVIFFMLFNYLPFNWQNNIKDDNKDGNKEEYKCDSKNEKIQKMHQNIKNGNYTLPEDVDEIKKGLMKSIFITNQFERTNVKDLLNNPFFNESYTLNKEKKRSRSVIKNEDKDKHFKYCVDSMIYNVLIS